MRAHENVYMACIPSIKEFNFFTSTLEKLLVYLLPTFSPIFHVLLAIRIASKARRLALRCHWMGRRPYFSALHFKAGPQY